MINDPLIQDANLFLSTTFLFMPREEGNDIGLEGWLMPVGRTMQVKKFESGKECQAIE